MTNAFIESPVTATPSSFDSDGPLSPASSTPLSFTSTAFTSPNTTAPRTRTRLQARPSTPESSTTNLVTRRKRTDATPSSFRTPARPELRRLLGLLSKEERAALRSELDIIDGVDQAQLQNIGQPEVTTHPVSFAAWWKNPPIIQVVSPSHTAPRLEIGTQTSLSRSTTFSTRSPPTVEDPFHFDNVSVRSDPAKPLEDVNTVITPDPLDVTQVLGGPLELLDLKLENAKTVEGLLDLAGDFLEELAHFAPSISIPDVHPPSFPTTIHAKEEVDWAPLLKYLTTPFTDLEAEEAESAHLPSSIAPAFDSTAPSQVSATAVVPARDQATLRLLAHVAKRKERMLEYRHSLPASFTKAAIPPFRPLSFDPSSLRTTSTSTGHHSLSESSVWLDFLEPDLLKTLAILDTQTDHGDITGDVNFDTVWGLVHPSSTLDF